MVSSRKTPGQRPPASRPLYFNTLTISRFMRACYGAQAPAEAQRHVIGYLRAGKSELAEIWKRVLAHLRGVEIKEDVRRIVKAARTLRVKR